MRYVCIYSIWCIIVSIIVIHTYTYLARAQRVGHRDCACSRAAARGDLLHHLGVAVCGEALAPVLLGYDHAEEALLLAAVPELLRHVSVLSDLVVVQQLAQLVHLLVEESCRGGGRAESKESRGKREKREQRAERAERRESREKIEQREQREERAERGVRTRAIGVRC
jgi:hypothetical protein